MTKKLKTICIILNFFIFTLIPAVNIFPAGSKSGDNKKSEKFWIGNIRIVHTASQHYVRSKSTKSKTSFSRKDHDLNDSVDILVCVKDNGNLCILNASRSFKERFVQESSGQDTKDVCPLTEEQMKHNILYRVKHFKQKVMYPGDSGKTKTTYDRDLYVSQEPKNKDQIDVRLSVRPDGNYGLTVYHITRINYKFHSRNEHKFVCAGKKRIVDTTITTGKIGDEPKTTRLVSGEGNNSTTLFTSVQPPLTESLVCVAQGKIEGDRISGHKVIIDKKGKKPGDKKEKYISHWDFTYAEPMHFMSDCFIWARDNLEKNLLSCFNKLNIQNNECDSKKLIECFISHFDPGTTGFDLDKLLIDLDNLEVAGILNRSECINTYCFVKGDGVAAMKRRSELQNCFKDVLSQYIKALKECELYGSCDTCNK